VVRERLTPRLEPVCRRSRFRWVPINYSGQADSIPPESRLSTVRGTSIEAQPLASMIELASRDGIRQRAKELAASMLEEDGVTNGVKTIEARMRGT
jgi:hypothetical protein